MRLGTAAASLALASALALTGCSAVDSVVEGVVNEGVEQLQGGVDELINEALGGTDISNDGQLPDGFPEADVPLVGEVRGGGAGPNGSGWVAQTTLTDAGQFAEAQTALEDAGFTSSSVSSDENSGFGSFDSSAHTVTLVVATEGSAAVATYIVTPK